MLLIYSCSIILKLILESWGSTMDCLYLRLAVLTAFEFRTSRSPYRRFHDRPSISTIDRPLSVLYKSILSSFLITLIEFHFFWRFSFSFFSYNPSLSTKWSERTPEIQSLRLDLPHPKNSKLQVPNGFTTMCVKSSKSSMVVPYSSLHKSSVSSPCLSTSNRRLSYTSRRTCTRSSPPFLRQFSLPRCSKRYLFLGFIF